MPFLQNREAKREGLLKDNTICEYVSYALIACGAGLSTYLSVDTCNHVSGVDRSQNLQVLGCAVKKWGSWGLGLVFTLKTLAVGRVFWGVALLKG